jgi:HTH-type transcriptional regulator/antitoxin HigA
MEIRPIRTDCDYRAALREIESLMDAQAGSPEGDRLDVLATLVCAYEANRFPIDPPDPIEAIKFRMEQRGLSRPDLERVLGGKNRVSEVLARKRALTLRMIRNLSRALDIPTDILVQEYALNADRATRKKRAGIRP